jgi:hypothetical protein
MKFTARKRREAAPAGLKHSVDRRRYESLDGTSAQEASVHRSVTQDVHKLARSSNKLARSANSSRNNCNNELSLQRNENPDESSSQIEKGNCQVIQNNKEQW